MQTQGGGRQEAEPRVGKSTCTGGRWEERCIERRGRAEGDGDTDSLSKTENASPHGDSWRVTKHTFSLWCFTCEKPLCVI